MRDNPCFKCENRHSTCHSTCEEYLTWKKDYDKEMKKARARKNGWNDRR